MIFIRSIRTLRELTICTILIVIAMVFLIFDRANLTQTNRKLQSNIKEKEKVVQKIETENDELIKKIEEKDVIIGDLEVKLKEVEKKLEELGSMESMSIPVNGFKSYMDYRSISKESKQGKIVYGDEAWTDGDGLRKQLSNYSIKNI